MTKTPKTDSILKTYYGATGVNVDQPQSLTQLYELVDFVHTCVVEMEDQGYDHQRLKPLYDLLEKTMIEVAVIGRYIGEPVYQDGIAL